MQGSGEHVEERPAATGRGRSVWRRYILGNISSSGSLSVMSAILRDKINELLTENGNLEKEVARLREAERACLQETTAPIYTPNTETPKDIIATATDRSVEVMPGLLS